MVEKVLTAKRLKRFSTAQLAFFQDLVDSINSTGVVVDNVAYDLGTFLDRDYDVRLFEGVSVQLQNIGLNSIDYKILGATKDFSVLDTDLVDSDFTEELVAETALGEAVKANGTVTIAGVLAGDTVTINGIVYTAVAGAKSGNTEFSIDGTDTVSATDLADSITNDTRVGTESLDQDAIGAAAVVTISAKLLGPAGDTITLASSDGGRLAVSGATLTGGADGAAAPFSLERKTPEITAVRIRAKETVGGSPGIIRADVRGL